MTRQANSTVASARPRRSAVAGRNRLQIMNKEPGYFYAIVNDKDDRISNLEARGYEIVPNAKVGAGGDKRVDSASAPGSASYISVGLGQKAVVMRIKDEWRKEDVQERALLVDETEQTLKNPKADYGAIKRTTNYSEG